MTERRWHIPEERDRLSPKEWRSLFLKQDGRCAREDCGTKLHVKAGIEVEVEEGDGPVASARDEHVHALSMGGTNKRSNRELWCEPCARQKDKQEAPVRAKSNRVRDKFQGVPKPPSKQKRVFPGSKRDTRTKGVNGVVRDRRTGKILSH